MTDAKIATEATESVPHAKHRTSGIAAAPQRKQTPRRRAPIRPPPPPICDICGAAKAHRRGLADRQGVT